MLKKILVASLFSFIAANAQAAPVINQINLKLDSGFYTQSIFGVPSEYVLSDGSTLSASPSQYWIPEVRPEAFGGDDSSAKVNSVQVTGNKVYYTFDTPKAYPVGWGETLPKEERLLFFINVGYDPEFALTGELAPYSPLVLQAELGSSIATMSGYARITENNNVLYDGAWLEGKELNFAAPIGALVYYEIQIELFNAGYPQNNVFTADFFDTDFLIHSTITGKIDFTNTLTIPAVPEPSTYAMVLAGLGLMGFAARRRKA